MEETITIGCGADGQPYVLASPLSRNVGRIFVVNNTAAVLITDITPGEIRWAEFRVVEGRMSVERYFATPGQFKREFGRSRVEDIVRDVPPTSAWELALVMQDPAFVCGRSRLESAPVEVRRLVSERLAFLPLPMADGGMALMT